MKIKIFLITFLILFFPFNINAETQEQEQEQEQEEVKLSENSNQEAKIYLNNIKAEIEKLGEHEWAGEYSFGDGLGVNINLYIAPNSGFLFTWYGCMGKYDQNFGDVKALDDKLVLNYKLPGSFASYSNELLTIKWGELLFLLPSNKIIDFCNIVNNDLDPRRFFLLKKTDKNKSLVGKPNLPSEFNKYLLEKPIKGEISEILENYVETSKKYSDTTFNITIIKINKGKKDNVLKGMEFHVLNQDFHDDIEIIDVKEDEAIGKIVEFILDLKEPIIIPQKGWKISTSRK